MTTTLVRPNVTATVDDQAVPVEGGNGDLDAGAVPYATAEIEVPLSQDVLDVLDNLDPRDDIRVVVTGAEETSGTSRTFDLGFRSRALNEIGTRILVQLASDEALLTDYATLVEDGTPRSYQASLRAVIDYVLGKIGASLADGPDDANVTAYWSVTNLFTNPSFETDLNGWAAGTNLINLGRTASGTAGVSAVSGSWMCWWGAAAAGVAYVDAPKGINVTPGKRYTAAVFMCATVARPCRVLIRWWDNKGTIVLDDYGPAVTCSVHTAGWTRITHIGATAPARAVNATVHFEYQAAGSGATVFNDAAMMYEGTELIDYFDGSTPDSPTYNYGWAQTEHASSSERTPIVNRPPELFVWKPGTTAWDFLRPLTTSVGLRLFCDEQRVWRLVDPATYEVPGYVTVTGANTTDAVDTISREDPDVFATGVVCRYAWEDTDGAGRIAYDTAGDPQKVVVIDYARAFPGPGAAAAILARRNGSGRTQDVTALTRWDTTPGMTASITLPNVGEQQGKLASVRFSFGDDSTMRLGTRGLIDIPPDSWAAVDPDEIWTDPPDITWAQW